MFSPGTLCANWSIWSARSLICLIYRFAWPSRPLLISSIFDLDRTSDDDVAQRRQWLWQCRPATTMTMPLPRRRRRWRCRNDDDNVDAATMMTMPLTVFAVALSIPIMNYDQGTWQWSMKCGGCGRSISPRGRFCGVKMECRNNVEDWPEPGWDKGHFEPLFVVWNVAWGLL